MSRWYMVRNKIRKPCVFTCCYWFFFCGYLETNYLERDTISFCYSSFILFIKSKHYNLPQHTISLFIFHWIFWTSRSRPSWTVIFCPTSLSRTTITTLRRLKVPVSQESCRSRSFVSEGTYFVLPSVPFQTLFIRSVLLSFVFGYSYLLWSVTLISPYLLKFEV